MAKTSNLHRLTYHVDGIDREALAFATVTRSVKHTIHLHADLHSVRRIELVDHPGLSVASLLATHGKTYAGEGRTQCACSTFVFQWCRGHTWRPLLDNMKGTLEGSGRMWEAVNDTDLTHTIKMGVRVERDRRSCLLVSAYDGIGELFMPTLRTWVRATWGDRLACQGPELEWADDPLHGALSIVGVEPRTHRAVSYPFSLVLTAAVYLPMRTQFNNAIKEGWQLRSFFLPATKEGKRYKGTLFENPHVVGIIDPNDHDDTPIDTMILDSTTCVLTKEEIWEKTTWASP